VQAYAVDPFCVPPLTGMMMPGAPFCTSLSTRFTGIEIAAVTGRMKF
jgi:hypothetical protein